MNWFCCHSLIDLIWLQVPIVWCCLLLDVDHVVHGHDHDLEKEIDIIRVLKRNFVDVPSPRPRPRPSRPSRPSPPSPRKPPRPPSPPRPKHTLKTSLSSTNDSLYHHVCQSLLEYRRVLPCVIFQYRFIWKENFSLNMLVFFLRIC